VEIDQGVLQIWDRRGRLLAKVNHGRNQLYVLHMEVAQLLCLATHRDDEAWRWHDRFGHLHFEVLRKLRRDQMVRRMPQIDHVEQLCDTYVLTKHKRQPFPRQASYHTLKQLELVHGNLYGPVTPVTSGGWRYFLLLVDDASRFMWAILLPMKAAVADAIMHVQAIDEMESGLKLQVLRTDNGGEFTAVKFTAYCAEGIQRHYFTACSPQQNDVVEHRNQTLVATASALLKQRGMPVEF
jgi:hypothetical protein